MFDVVYEDGTRRSNRKGPRALTGGIDGDKQAGGRFSDRTGPSTAVRRGAGEHSFGFAAAANRYRRCLKVVSRSTFDLKTVLQIFVESVGRICEADMTAIRRPKGSAFLHDASHSSPIVIPSRRSEGPSLGEFC